MLLAQKPFWQRHLAYPHINLDTVAHSLRLTGPLDTTLLLSALHLTVSEIDLFRARFLRKVSCIGTHFLRLSTIKTSASTLKQNL